MGKRILVLLLAIAVWSLSCGSDPDGELAPTGVAQIAIVAAPSDVQCVIVTVTAPQGTYQRSFDVTPGQSTLLTVSGLPVGSDTFQASAYASACSAVTSSTPATYISTSVMAQVSSTTPVSVTLTMQRAGQANVSIDFPCPTGFADCDMSTANGCETNTNTTVTSCGGCGIACSTAHNTATCSNGACVIGTCSAGFANCDASTTNGCETNTATTLTSCGGCSVTCSTAHNTATCSNGACVVGTCSAGFANCDGNGINGCETNTATSASNCGACGNVCSAANGTVSCVNSVCTVGTCNTGFANCDTSGNNGCETNTTSSVSNCGGCGIVCSTAHNTATCTNSVCVVGTCSAGFANCDMSGTNGCETSITTTSNCGGCGVVCATGQSCVSGHCQ